MVSRRTMIAGGAGAAVLGALGYRAWDRGAFTAGEGPAFEAWREWQGRAGEGPTRSLHAAILAASAHNTQPWLFEPHDDSITVYADLSRNIGTADPFRRELLSSVGCAIENLRAIAVRFGRLAKISPMVSGRLPPPSSSTLLKTCEVTLQPLLARYAEYHPDLYSAIPYRHTNRGPYRPGQRIAVEFLSAWNHESPITLIDDKAAMKDLGALIVDATKAFIADKTMSQDSARWFRTGAREIEASRDGIDTDGAGLSTLMGVAAKLLPDQGAASADAYWLATTRDTQVPTAAAFGVIMASDRLNALEALGAGLAWQNFHLEATIAGLAAQPMNAPIEMMDRDLLLGRKNEYAKEIRKIAGISEGDPAFIFRLGYAERPAVASPRRRLQDVIKATA